MSDCFLKSELESIDIKLKVTDCSLPFINQSNVDDNDIALAVDIPYPVLIKWHGLAGRQDDQGKIIDYIDLLNFWIPGHWFKIDKVNGSRIQGRLRREVGVIVNKYTGRKAGGSKRQEAKSKVLTLHIRESELVKPKELEEALIFSDAEIKEWKLKCEHLEKERDEIANEMKRKLNERENEIEQQQMEINDLNKELLECISM